MLNHFSLHRGIIYPTFSLFSWYLATNYWIILGSGSSSLLASVPPFHLARTSAEELSLQKHYVYQVTSVVSNSVQPYGLQPARLVCPWDSLGKNTEVGCHALPSWNLPAPEIKPTSLMSSPLADKFFNTSATYLVTIQSELLLVLCLGSASLGEQSVPEQCAWLKTHTGDLCLRKHSPGEQSSIKVYTAGKPPPKPSLKSV